MTLLSNLVVGICFCELPFLKPERLCKDLSGSEEASAINVGCFNVKPPDSKLWALPPPFPALTGCCRTAGGTHLVRTVGRIGRLASSDREAASLEGQCDGGGKRGPG